MRKSFRLDNTHYYPSWPNYCKGIYAQVGQSGAPLIQTFPNNNAVFQDDSVPIHTAGNVQSWFEEHEGELQHLPWLAQSPHLNIIETY
jgi:hypothetical protein